MPEVVSEREVRLVYWYDSINWLSFIALDLSSRRSNYAYELPLYLHRILHWLNDAGDGICKNAMVYSVNYWLYQEIAKNAEGYAEPDALCATLVKDMNTVFNKPQPILWYDWCRGLVGVGPTYKSMIRVPIDKFLSWDEPKVLSWGQGKPRVITGDMDDVTRRL